MAVAVLAELGIETYINKTQWRCAACHTMQKPGTVEAWVADGTMKHDPAWSVRERQKQNRLNGHSSAWCVDCAMTLAMEEGGRI